MSEMQWHDLATSSPRVAELSLQHCPSNKLTFGGICPFSRYPMNSETRAATSMVLLCAKQSKNSQAPRNKDNKLFSVALMLRR